MAFGIDGLVSGLDTTALIDALIKAEAGPQTLLKAKAASQRSFVTDLQSLNTALSALATSTADWADPAKLRSTSATSSASSVTVTAGTTAQAGSLSFRVDRLAQAQVSVTGAMTAWTGGPTLTIQAADGTRTEVSTGDSLAELAANITASGAGVTATLVPAGVDGGGQPQFRLQLTGATGAGHGFGVFAGTAADVAAGTAPDVLAQPGAATVSAAQDARLILWPGTGAEQAVTSSSNRFAGVLTGVDVTVSKLEADPVTITVTRPSTVNTTATSFVANVNSILAGIRTKSSVGSTTDGTGNTRTTAGSFTGDFQIRELASALTRAVVDPVDGRSPAEIGISVDRFGVLQLDAAKLSAAMQADPAGTEAAFAEIAGRVHEVADRASDKTDGAITTRIADQQTDITSIDRRVAEWDDRLAVRRARLVSTYAAMETALSRLQSQGAWLESQLSTLDTGSRK